MDRLKGDQIYHKDGYRNLPTARSSLSNTTSCGQDFLDILVPVSYTAVHRKQVLIKDFKDVKSIGQAFADEIFRIWKSSHKDVNFIIQNANENVMLMIKRAQV